MSATSKKIRVGDIGTQVLMSFVYTDAAGVEQQLSLANARRIEFTFEHERTTGAGTVRFTRTAQVLTPGGGDGKAVYYTQPGDFLCEGAWTIQGLAEIAGSSPEAGTWRTEIQSFEAEGNTAQIGAQPTPVQLAVVVPSVTIS